jgi:tetratricopeptide (TPR) repeat protein
VEIFRSKAGPLHLYHCRLAYNYAWILIWRHQFDQARDLLERFLNDIEFHADRDNLHSRATRYLLAQIYLALHQFSKAELRFRKIIDRATQGLGEDRAHLVTFEAWRMLAVIANFHDRFEERKAFEQKALECGQMTYGPWQLRVTLTAARDFRAGTPDSRREAVAIYQLIPCIRARDDC